MRPMWLQEADGRKPPCTDLTFASHLWILALCIIAAQDSLEERGIGIQFFLLVIHKTFTQAVKWGIVYCAASKCEKLSIDVAV